MTENNSYQISLVLGSGGARGYAHIGVIRWIEEQGIKIESVAGASMGALVGGIYAADKLNEYADWAMAIRKTDVVRLLDFTLSKSGFVDGTRIMDALRAFIGDHEISELPVRFTAVASDLAREREVWINTGSLFDAIRASIALPFVFVPFERGGRRLVDGGILNPIPIAPTFNDHTDFTVAVSLSGAADESLQVPEKPPRESKDRKALQGLIERFLGKLQNQFTRDTSDDWSMLDIALRTFDSMQATIARTKLAAYPPDIVVSIPQDIASIMEFDRAEALIDIGYQAAKAQLPPFLRKRSDRARSKKKDEASPEAES